MPNPGIKDFRDPKVSWYAPQQKWIMTLATQDRITFYSSKNLKKWNKESEFGATIGAHGGVWECPDLITLDYEGKTYYALIVSINPGGPNSGSATQYFTGNFDGNKFVPADSITRWIDYGPDDYAGVTWSNTGKRRVFLGWMSNWNYANKVPTEKWRSANTVPRDLKLDKNNHGFIITSAPSPELNQLANKTKTFESWPANGLNIEDSIVPASFSMQLSIATDFSITLANSKNERIIVGYEKASNRYFIDRTNSGDTSFSKGFGTKLSAPRLSDKTEQNLTLIIDQSSVELFGDDGSTVLTSLFFPSENYNRLTVDLKNNKSYIKAELKTLKSIY